MQSGLSSILAIRGLGEPLLHHIAPLGLASAAGTALVVDCDGTAPGYPGPTAADLIDRGVRRADLVPPRAGVAILGNGGLELDAVMELVGALRKGWPALVLRAGEIDPPGIPVVPVVPLLPAPLAPRFDGPCLVQRLGRAQAALAGGIELPPLSRSQIGLLLAGRVDPRWRWVKAFRRVWELAWR